MVGLDESFVARLGEVLGIEIDRAGKEDLLLPHYAKAVGWSTGTAKMSFHLLCPGPYGFLVCKAIPLKQNHGAFFLSTL